MKNIRKFRGSIFLPNPELILASDKEETFSLHFDTIIYILRVSNFKLNSDREEKIYSSFTNNVTVKNNGSNNRIIAIFTAPLPSIEKRVDTGKLRANNLFPRPPPE